MGKDLRRWLLIWGMMLSDMTDYYRGRLLKV